MNNIQFFDEMNIMQTEKTKRIKMSGSLQSKIERVFKWAGSFDDLLFYFVYFRRHMNAAYVSFANEYMIDETIIEEYALLFTDLICDSTMRNIGSNYNLSRERAAVIARNEVNRIENRVEYEDAVANGYRFHRWVSESDDKTRPWHLTSDGQIKGINEPFYVGGEKMMFPMDTSLGAGAGNILNCRCTEVYLR